MVRHNHLIIYNHHRISLNNHLIAIQFFIPGEHTRLHMPTYSLWPQSGACISGLQNINWMWIVTTTIPFRLYIAIPSDVRVRNRLGTIFGYQFMKIVQMKVYLSTFITISKCNTKLVAKLICMTTVHIQRPVEPNMTMVWWQKFNISNMTADISVYHEAVNVQEMAAGRCKYMKKLFHFNGFISR